MATRNSTSIARKSKVRKGAAKSRVRPRNSSRASASTHKSRVQAPLAPVLVSTSFTNAFTKSPADAERVTSDLLTANAPGTDRLSRSGELLHWVSASGTLQHRRTLIAGFRKAGATLPLIHHIATLPREQAAAFMQDYFKNGGTIEPVIEWLGIAGNTLRAARRPLAGRARAAAHWTAPRNRAARGIRTRGLFSWVGDVVDGIKKIGKGIADAVSSVVDAVVKAGKSIASAISAAVSWTVAKVTDLVEALIRAGKKVADILAAAATKGLEQLKKFVEAVIAAGRSVGEVLAWAAGKLAATANAVVAKLLQLGRSVLTIVKAVVTLGRNALVTIVKGLLAAGRTLANLMAAIAAESLSVMKSIADALLAAGHSLRNILTEAARLAASACRTMLSALMALGKSLAALLQEAAAAVGNTLRLVVQGLLALGKSLAQVVVAVAALAANTAKAVIQALLALGKSLADLAAAAVGQALTVVKAVFKALLAAGRKVVEILVALAKRTVSALRTALQALLAMGVSLASLVKDICIGVGQAFRRGFFQGLVALGKAPLQLLKAAAEASVSVLLLAFAVVMEMFGGYKPLSAIPGAEAEAKKVFGSTINLKRVKIGFAKLPGDIIRYLNIEMPRAFTTMYLLNFGPGAIVDIQTIIHELAHVWQGVQTGPLYMTRALEAQIGAGVQSLFHTGKYDDSASYRVTEADLVAKGGDLKKFNPEQQATIMEFYWIRKHSRYAHLTSGFPAKIPTGVVLPRLEALEPYAQKVNPALRAPARKTMKKKAAPAKRSRGWGMGGRAVYA